MSNGAMLGIGVAATVVAMGFAIQVTSTREAERMATGLPDAYYEIVDNGLAPERVTDRTRRARDRDAKVRRAVQVSFRQPDIEYLMCLTDIDNRLELAFAYQGDEGKRVTSVSDAKRKEEQNTSEKMLLEICRIALHEPDPAVAADEVVDL